MGYYPDYAVVIIGANRGILPMTREHIKILHHLKIPMIIALTKIDLIEKICTNTDKNSKEMLDGITGDIKKIFSKGNYDVIDMNLISTTPDDQNNQDNQTELFNIIPNTKQIPLFKISSKTGFGLGIFKNYISKLPKNKTIISCPIADQILLKTNKKQIPNSIPYVFYIEKIYCPQGIGWVVTGILRCSDPEGYLGIGSSCYLGPNVSEQIQVKIWSIYNYYHEKIDKIYSGQRACLAIRSDKKLTCGMFRKGTIITNSLEIIKYASYKYKAIVKLLSHPTTLRDNFSPVIHCATIRQSAKITILEIKNKQGKKINYKDNEDNKDTDNDQKKEEKEVKHICPGDTAVICLEFKFNPEIIEPNESFFLREGLCMGVGTILEPMN